VAAVVPAAAVNVTVTPACQLLLVKLMVPGLEVMAVLPLRVSVTATVPVGAADNRTLVVPVVLALALPAMLTVLGLATIDGVEDTGTMLNGIAAVEVDNGGFALSKAVACAVWLPTLSDDVLKL
jgi:hypothetical protein